MKKKEQCFSFIFQSKMSKHCNLREGGREGEREKEKNFLSSLLFFSSSFAHSSFGRMHSFELIEILKKK